MSVKANIFQRTSSETASVICCSRPLIAAAFVLFPASARAEPQSQTQNAWTVSISIAVVVITAAVAYIFNSRIEKKRSQLKFVSEQLQYLYGPLYSLNSASKQAWETFRQNCRPSGSFFDEYDPASQNEIEEWRHWMCTVFMPINKRIEEVIINNIHLVEGATIPDSFLSVLAHVASYRAVVEKWPKLAIVTGGDFAETIAQNTAAINFPTEFCEDVGRAFHELKDRQMKLAASFGR